MDAANLDLKAFTERFYRKICGAHLQGVLDTLLYLKNETDVWFELTTLLIPGENDSSEELDAMTRWVVDELGPDVPMHFTAFHPDYKMRDKPPTPPSTLTRAREIRLGQRGALRLHGQRSRRARRYDVLPRVRHTPGRPRLVRVDHVEPERRGPLHTVRHTMCRAFLGPGRGLGSPASAGAAG